MLSVGRWVLDGACRQLRQWRNAQLEVPLIAVNISLAQVRAGQSLVQDVKECLRRFDLAPRALELDVTEHILARNPSAKQRIGRAASSWGTHCDR